MKFGEALRVRVSEGPEEFAPYYLRYDELKLLLKVLPRHHSSMDVVSVQTAMNRRLTPTGSLDEVAQAAMTEERFVNIVEDDLQRIGRWVTMHSESLHTKLGALMASCSDESYPVDYLREQADELGRMTCELDKLILLNYEGFLKIAKKHDKWIGLSTRPWMLARLSSATFFHERFDKIVSGLSDAYAILRLREHPEDVGVWEPPSEFNRNTTKYWVKPEDVLSIKCAMVKHIPVLIFGRKLTVGAGGGANQPSDSSLITSVYLDNDALDVYHTRLERRDGATLFRFRWYGPCSGPKQAVFVERKTHRGPAAKKAGLLSVKERFKVTWADISDLLLGRMDLVKRVEEPMRAEGAKEEDIAYAMHLAGECQQEIVARRLQPVSTTVYYRTSFQLSSGNAVRSTLDCQLRMVDETSTRSCLAPGEWYRPLNNEPIRDVHEFPYSVLEVKLQGDAPGWVTALIDSGKITKCYKFSKYLHSIVALGHPVQKPPHWFGEDNKFLLLPFGPTGVSNSTSSSGAPSVAGGVPHLSPSKLAETRVAVAELGSLLLTKDGGPSTPPTGMQQPCDGSIDLEQGGGSTDGAGGDSTGTGSTGTGSSGQASSDEGKGKKDKDKKRKEEKREKKEEKSPKERKEKDKEEKPNKRDDKPKREPSQDKLPGDGEPPRAKTLVRKRVDPKTLFANERTMLQWLNMAVLLVFTSLALLATSTAITNNGEASTNAKAVAGGAQLCGAILAPAAILVMLYAMWQYYWRISRITDPDEDARFEDKFGPLVLVFMIIVVCSVAIVISINRFSWAQLSEETKKHKGDDRGAVAGAQPQQQLQQQQQQQQQQMQPQHLQQQQPIEFGGPRSTLMLLQTGSGARLRLLSWATAAFCCSMYIAIVVTSRSPVLIAYRRRLWRKLQGVQAGDDEDEGLLGCSKGGASWGGGKAGWGGGGYGSAEACDVPAFEASGPPPHATVTIRRRGFQRAPNPNAVWQRWDQLVATVIPDGRTRLHVA